MSDLGFILVLGVALHAKSYEEFLMVLLTMSVFGIIYEVVKVL